MSSNPPLTLDEAAARLGVTRRQARALVHAGELNAFDVSTGKSRAAARVLPESISQFIERRLIRPAVTE